MVIIVLSTEKFFFPHRKILKLFTENYSPDLLKKIIYAGGNSSSFDEARKNLEVLGEIFISQSHIQRLAVRIGKELTAAEEKEAGLWDELMNIEKSGIDVASVSIDGGRAQIRDEDCGVGVHNPAWTETKVGCLQILNSKETSEDPHPLLPKIFKDKEIVNHLLEGLKGYSAKNIKEPEHDEKHRDNLKKSGPSMGENKDRYGPEVVKRFAFATVDNANTFGNAVLNRAHRYQLHTAVRKAYIGDGDIKIWTIYEDYFRAGGWTAILDFIHAVEYAFEAAKLYAGESSGILWANYIELLTHIWQGRVLTVLRKLDKIINDICSAKKKSYNHQQKIERLQAIRTYFKNNYKRMDYPEYRKKGLPVSSSHVESLIKQFNKRIKASDKFWNRTSLKGMLKIKASFLSSDNPMQKFWDNRYNQQTNSKRPYAKQVF